MVQYDMSQYANQKPFMRNWHNILYHLQPITPIELTSPKALTQYRKCYNMNLIPVHLSYESFSQKYAISFQKS